jgi:hypothetical protein
VDVLSESSKHIIFNLGPHTIVFPLNFASTRSMLILSLS